MSMDYGNGLSNVDAQLICRSITNTTSNIIHSFYFCETMFKDKYSKYKHFNNSEFTH